MRALYFLLAALAALALAGGEVKVKLDLTGLELTDAEENFAERVNAVVNLPAAGALVWSSASVKADAGEDAKASADAMIGFGMLPAVVGSTFLKIVPFGVMAYGSGKAAVDFDYKNLDWHNAGFSGKLNGGVVAMAALGMEEIDEDGKRVGKFIPFTSPGALNWDKACKAEKITGEDGKLEGQWCRYKPLGEGFGVTATLVTSEVPGIMEYGHTPVSPRSYSLIIGIDDYDFADKKKNHLRLKFALYTLSGKGEIEGQSLVGANDDMDDIYLAMSRYAMIDGDREKVEVNIKSGSVDGEIEADVEGAITAALGGKSDLRVATVDFPVGAKNFIYDPAMGVGSNVYDAGASTIALSALVALICALVALF